MAFKGTTTRSAKDIAEDGDIVTLSPACASFDMFPNFEVRGNKFKEIVKNLDKALDKLPTYRGEVSRSLWFHTNDEVNDFVKQHCINSEITYSAFTSSTAGSVYNKEAQVQLCWYSNKGKDMIKYNPEEKEVLYPRNSKFKVVDITKDGNVYNITLEEI